MEITVLDGGMELGAWDYDADIEVAIGTLLDGEMEIVAILDRDDEYGTATVEIEWRV